MTCANRRIFSPLLLVLIFSLAGCMGGSGGIGLRDKSSANVSVLASTSSITEGRAVTLEAYVNPTLATGTVTFYNGSTAIGTASISSPLGFSTTGIALLATTFSSVGVQSITARYSGNDFYSAGTSAATSISVYSDQLASTSVILQASTTAPQYQTSVTLTAAVSPSSATGTIAFYNGGAMIGSAAVHAGAASVTTSFAAGGTATLHAVYSGDYSYASSNSNSLTMNVSGPLITSTTLQASTRYATIGDSVTLTANLTPATATGAVTFYAKSVAIGSANVNAGVATLITRFATPEYYTLTVSYAGNSSWEPSASGQVSLWVTGNTPDTVVLQVAPSPLVIGYSATLTATISPAAATGDIIFYDGTSDIGMCTIAGGTCSFVKTFMNAGSHSLTAAYSGDTTYILSTVSPVILQVSNPGPTPTTTALELSEYSGYTGDAVTLTALVNPSAATGQIDFYDNGALLESVVLTSGKAAWAQFFTQAGDNNITAVYDGDVTYSVSTSGSQDLVLSYPSDPNPPPSCPTDPVMCGIVCPLDPTCPYDPDNTLGDATQRSRLTAPLKLKGPALRF